MTRKAVKSIHRREYEILLTMLTEARIQAGRTQGDLARLAGLSQPTISDIESGKRRVDVVELFDIVRALGADPLEFIKAYASATEP